MFNNQALDTIKYLRGRSNDISEKRIPLCGGDVWIFYIRQIVYTRALSEYIIKPIMQYASSEKKTLKARQALDSVIVTDDAALEEDFLKAEQYILSGNCVLLFSGDSRYISVNIRKTPQRQISAPEFRYSQRGPRDAFIEEINTNLSLIRKRLKDRQLTIEKFEVGKRSKTAVAVLHIKDIANPDAVSEVKKRIKAIDTDMVIESGELQTFLLNSQHSLFPQVGLLEKPDQAVEKLLEGKTVILIDGSCTGLSAPKTFIEFFYSEDDHYEDHGFGAFMRVIRQIALYVSILSTSLYIATGEYNPDLLPPTYIITFAQLRARAPFSPFIAVLILELIVELMREALLRVPAKIGSAIAIVGGIIIGQAASTSGAFSPLLLILVSVGFLATFAQPDYTLINSFRILKFMLIFLTGTFGFYGLAVGATFILSNLVSINSFGVPYTAPFAPFNLYDFVRTLVFRRTLAPKRQQYMRNIDDTRTSSANDLKNKKKGKPS